MAINITSRGVNMKRLKIPILLLITLIELFAITSYAKKFYKKNKQALAEMTTILTQRVDEVNLAIAKLEAKKTNPADSLKEDLGNKITSYFGSLALYKEMANNHLDKKTLNLIAETTKRLENLNPDQAICRNPDVSKFDLKPQILGLSNILLTTQTNCPGCLLSFDRITRNTDGSADANYLTTNYKTPNHYLKKSNLAGTNDLILAGPPNPEFTVFLNARLCCQMKASNCKNRSDIILWDFKNKKTQTYANLEEFNKLSGHTLNCTSSQTEASQCSLDNTDVLDQHTDKTPNKFFLQQPSKYFNLNKGSK